MSIAEILIIKQAGFCEWVRKRRSPHIRTHRPSAKKQTPYGQKTVEKTALTFPIAGHIPGLLASHLPSD